jgi:hypothetical protein
VDADGGDEADALLVAAPDLGPQHPGSDHAHVAVELEATEGRAEAAGHDHQGLVPGPERQRRDHVVGHQEAQDVGFVGGVDVLGGEAVGPGRVAGGVGPHADPQVDA